MSRQPEIVETVNKRNQELSERLDDLLELELKIEELEKRIEQMSQTKRNSFYQSVTKLKKQANNANTPNELLDLRSEVTEAVRSPLQQAAQQALKQFLSEFQLELSRQERAEAIETVKSIPPDDLESFATTYQNLTERVQGLEEIPRDIFALWVEDYLDQLQKVDNLNYHLSELEEQQTKLKKIEAAFEVESNSIPALDLTGTARFYKEEARDISSVSEISLKLDAIMTNARRIKSQGLEVNAGVREEFESWYNSGDPSELSDKMTSIQGDLLTIERRFQTVEDLTAKLEECYNDDETQEAINPSRANPEDSVEDAFLPQINELLEREEKIKTYQFKSLSHMKKEIDDLETAADDLVDSLYNQLSTLREFYEAVDDSGNMTTSQICKIDKSPLQRKHICDSPVAALKEYHTLQGWLYENIDSEQSGVIELWKSLSEGDPVDITSQNKEAVIMLADRIQLTVMLGDQHE